MATPQLSPGVLVREVDLTVGRAENVLDNIGAIAGPFALGPVNEPITIETQQQFLDTFGKPIGTDRQYEYWMAGNSFLSYGGILKVVRVTGATLNNGNAGTDEASAALKIDNLDDYEENHTTDSSFYWAARNPGTWSNSLKVCTIDNKSDQIISIGTTNPGASGFVVGYGVSTSKAAINIPGNGNVTQFNGSLKGIITGVTTDAQNSASTIEVKVLARVLPVTETTANIGFTTISSIGLANTSVLSVNSTAGITTGTIVLATNNGGIPVVSFGSSTVTLSVGIAQSALVGTAVTYQTLTSIAGSVTSIDYQNYNSANSFTDGDTLVVTTASGGISTTFNSNTSTDWYDQQTLGLTNSTVYWRNVAAKPVSNRYVTQRSGSNDAMHVVVVDDTGDVTGVQGNIVERFVFLSKSTDATADGDNPTRIYYKDFIAQNSRFTFAGFNPSSSEDTYWGTIPIADGFSTGTTPYTVAEGLWGQESQGINFSSLGNVSYTLSGGIDYSATGGMAADLPGLDAGYNLFANKDEVAVDYLIMGPSLGVEAQSQAKANLLISIAEQRKDCIATISPHRENVVNVADSRTQTQNVLGFYSPLASSSYAVFDSGYKYTYDRFNNAFRYIPTNGDTAGLMVRTGINAYPWFSPAGLQRGILNNAVKMAYSPNKNQRDELYGARVNSIINQKGAGIALYGDKTALGYASAFDRINVRRLFLTVEQALEGAANDQLFELNDSNTRANFVNIVEPYLRDVQAKRGIYDFRVICDETNNTPNVIDNNEFRADIFLKPTKSINFVTLTFVATRTGVDFEEVIGTV
jgi:endonuclease YncB( thermonuclease family)